MNHVTLIQEINYLLFLAVLIVTVCSCAAYITFFLNQKSQIRKWARFLLIGSWVLQSGYIATRYMTIGNTPITTYHEAVFFFAWAATSAYLSFRWPYTV